MHKRRNITICLEAQMKNLKNSGNIKDYNTQVSLHNDLVSDYNTHLSTYRALFTQYEHTAQVHNYILEHQFDRPGVYEYIQQNIPV